MFALNVGESLLSLIIPGIVSIVIVILTNRGSKQDKQEAGKTDLYKAELESLSKQREAASSENEKLRDALREELEDCRELRRHLETGLEELKVKVNTIEAELFAWRNGLKTPSGFVLVRMPPENAANLDQK